MRTVLTFAAAFRPLRLRPSPTPFTTRRPLATMKKTDAPALTDRVLSYWFGDTPTWYATGRELQKKWYSGGAVVDAEIRQQFAQDISSALCGERDELLQCGARGELAYVLLLDQFTRNVYRGTKEAFAGDARAIAVSLRALDERASAVRKELRPVERVFMYTPLMHAEDEKVSVRCLDAMRSLRDELRTSDEAGAAECADMAEQSLKFSQEHLDIVRRFGRFPHRNEVLGRTTTEEEVAFLEDGPRYGQ